MKIKACFFSLLFFTSAAAALVTDEIVLIKEARTLTGRIEVKDLRGVDQQNIRVRIAEPSLYQKMGLAYRPLLADLKPRFVSVNEEEGLVSIDFPFGVEETFDLLLEFDWPQGYLVHRYIVRLKTDLFVTEDGVTVRINPADILAAEKVIDEQTIESINEEMRPVKVDIVDGDNWHNIAQAIQQAYLRGAPINLDQVMLALRDANTADFTSSSVLHIGASLRLPDYYDIAAIDPEEARQVLALLFAKQESKPRLELSVVEPNEDIAQVTEQTVLEELDTVRREEADIRSDLVLVDAQLEQIEKLIALKNEEIAVIQSAVAEQETEEVDSLTDAFRTQEFYDLETALRQRQADFLAEIQSRPFFWLGAGVLIILFLGFFGRLSILLRRRYKRSQQDRASLMKELRRNTMADGNRQSQLWTSSAGAGSVNDTAPPFVPPASPARTPERTPPAVEMRKADGYIDQKKVAQEKKNRLQDNPKKADLDLALAFINMSEPNRARSLLMEVLKDGTEEEKAKAQALLEKISN